MALMKDSKPIVLFAKSAGSVHCGGMTQAYFNSKVDDGTIDNIVSTNFNGTNTSVYVTSGIHDNNGGYARFNIGSHLSDLEAGWTVFLSVFGGTTGYVSGYYEITNHTDNYITINLPYDAGTWSMLFIYYGGTLVIEIPQGANGTYNIDFIYRIWNGGQWVYYTFFSDSDDKSSVHGPLILTPAKITVDTTGDYNPIDPIPL